MRFPIKITKQEIGKIYKPILLNTHKGIQGHALIIGGSYGKMGSVCLSSKAAIKSGCGLVTEFIPKCGYDIVQISIPEVMVLTDVKENYITNIDYDFIPNAIGIGIGIGQEVETQNAIHKLLFDNKIPMVIDDDALNILSLNPIWISLLQPKTILTSHPKELKRLVGKWISEEEKISKTIEFFIKFNNYNERCANSYNKWRNSLPKYNRKSNIGNRRKWRCSYWNNHQFSGSKI